MLDTGRQSLKRAWEVRLPLQGEVQTKVCCRPSLSFRWHAAAHNVADGYGSTNAHTEQDSAEGSRQEQGYGQGSGVGA